MSGFDFESGVQGATAGAGFGWPGAAVGFVAGGFLGDKGKKGAAKSDLRNRRRAAGYAGPANITAAIQQLSPVVQGLYRLNAYGQQGRVDAALGRAGAFNTGRGAMMRTAAMTGPMFQAAGQAVNLGAQSAFTQAGAFGSTRPLQNTEFTGSGATLEQLARFGGMLGTLGKRGGKESEPLLPPGSQTGNPDTWGERWL